jgi:epoxyqueuosine reductase
MVMTPAPTDLKTKLVDEARAIGFADIGFTRPSSIPEASPRLQAFLDAGFHGDMDWMMRPMRQDPRAIWAEARSVIMLTFNYGPSHDPLEILDRPDKAAISVYAQGHDYHDIIKKKLKQLARWLIAEAGGDVKVFVDTAPLMEKPLAQAAGLGWQGKHTNMISRHHGSWTFLGSIFTTLELAADPPGDDHCGQCSACLDICPTQAFPAPYRLDARKCISYLTIEHKGHIDIGLRSKMGNRIYGCDDCLAVCPWNKFAQSAAEMKLQARQDLRAPDLIALAQIDDAQFREMFRGSPIKRIGHKRFLRNVLIALGNLGAKAEDGHVDAVVARLAHTDAIVRAMAVWALWQIAPQIAREHCALAQQTERDENVRREWGRGDAYA